MTGSYLKQLTPDSSRSTFCNSMATSEFSHYHTNTSPGSSANCATLRLQNSTQRTVACNISMRLSTSAALSHQRHKNTTQHATTITGKPESSVDSHSARRSLASTSICAVPDCTCAPRLLFALPLILSQRRHNNKG